MFVIPHDIFWNWKKIPSVVYISEICWEWNNTKARSRALQRVQAKQKHHVKLKPSTKSSADEKAKETTLLLAKD